MHEVGQAEDEAALRLSQLFTIINQCVQSKELFASGKVKWTNCRNQFSSALAKRLHNLYAGEKYEWPARYGVFVGLMLGLEISSIPQPVDAPARTLVFLALAIPIVTYSATGAYWSLYELAINDRLSRKIKLLNAALMAILLLIWLGMGSPRIWADAATSEVGVRAAIAVARHSNGYLIASAVFVYVPAICYGVFISIRILSAVMLQAGMLIRWGARVNSIEGPAHLAKFVSTQLPDIRDGESCVLLKLDQRDIDALLEWATLRREVVRDRLVPTTLVLAFVGLIANTSLGETGIGAVGSILRRFFTLTGDLRQMAVFFIEYSLLVAAIVFPVVVISNLLTEAFAVDYIAQACVLARHAKLAGKQAAVADDSDPATSHDAPPLARFCRKWFR